ncbi:Cytochrome P450, partial [Penicillium concentricum]
QRYLLKHDRLSNLSLDRTCDQPNSFLFADHDITDILLQWTFYELSRTPHMLRRVCIELDDIFSPGSHPTHIRDQILEHRENILQRTSYTSAVIKEILCLYPPARTSRFPPLTLGSAFGYRISGDVPGWIVALQLRDVTIPYMVTKAISYSLTVVGNRQVFGGPSSADHATALDKSSRTSKRL